MGSESPPLICVNPEEIQSTTSTKSVCKEEGQCALCTLVEEFRCPISGLIIFDPCVASDGQLYERDCLEKWLLNSNKSPKTGDPLDSKRLYSSQTCKTIIDEILATHPQYLEEQYLPKELLLSLAIAHDIPRMKILIRRNHCFLKTTFEMANCQMLIHIISAKGTLEEFNDILSLYRGFYPEMTVQQLLLLPSVAEGWTPIHFAFDSANKPIVERMQTICASSEFDFDAIQNFWNPSLLKKTPRNIDFLLLQSAAKGDHVKLKFFLALGANVEAKDPNNGYTPLLSAIAAKQKECVELLLNAKANIEARDNFMNTPLLTAAFGGKLDIVQLLLKWKAGLEATNQWNWTPLLMSIVRGHFGVIRHLISFGAKLDVQDVNGFTPAMWASKLGFQEIVEFIEKTKVSQCMEQACVPFQFGHIGVGEEAMIRLKRRDSIHKETGIPLVDPKKRRNSAILD